MENNNDKAKQILFGSTDIDHENAATEALKKLKRDNPEDFKPQSQWNDPEMTGIIPQTKNGAEFQYDPQASMDIQNEKVKEGTMDLKEFHKQWLDPEYLRKRYEDTDNASDFISFCGQNSKWIADIHNYCHDNNCSPQDLIDCYSKYHTLPPKE